MNKPNWYEDVTAFMNERGSLLIDARAQATLFAQIDADKVAETFQPPINPAIADYLNAKEM